MGIPTELHDAIEQHKILGKRINDLTRDILSGSCETEDDSYWCSIFYRNGRKTVEPLPVQTDDYCNLMESHVVIDVETTGLDVTKDEIISFSAFGCDGKSLHIIVNPMVEISEEASKINGFKNSDLIDKPVFDDVICQILDFIENYAFIVAHNGHRFDFKILERKFGFELQNKFDTRDLSRKIWPSELSGLDAILDRLGYAQRHGEHDSMSDCRMTQFALLKMIDIMKRRGSLRADSAQP